MKTTLFMISMIFVSPFFSFAEGDHSDHDAHEESEASQNVISPQALINMNVVIQEIDSSNYTVYTPVPAYIKPHPLSVQPIYAPFGGIIKLKQLEPGQYIQPNEVIATIIRDPIARPKLNLIEKILNPASEEFHNAVAKLLITKKSLDVLNQEIIRIESFKNSADGISIIPQKDYFNLKYERTKTTQELENSRSKLEFHGLKSDEILKLEKGGKIMPPKNIWVNSLKKNNIWNDLSEELYQSLDSATKSNRWVIATIGEISAEGLLNRELMTFLKSHQAAKSAILEIASLLQQGNSIENIKNFIEQGALSNIIEIKAPNNQIGWDLNAIKARNGKKVITGETLFELLDPSKKILTSEPSGSELIHLKQVSQEHASFNATSLIPNSSIPLNNLKISSFQTNGLHKSSVYIPVKNTLLSNHKIENTTYRNWTLIDGTKYKLKLPLQQLKDVIVVPSEAIIEHGSDKVVFVKYENEVIRRNVIILYQNDEIAVIGKGSELLPDEPIVVKGSFALQLALVAGTPEAVDPHAGHSH